jgi:hypothetical protein
MRPVTRLRSFLGCALLVALGIKAASLVIDPIIVVLAGLLLVSLLASLFSDL